MSGLRVLRTTRSPRPAIGVLHGVGDRAHGWNRWCAARVGVRVVDYLAWRLEGGSRKEYVMRYLFSSEKSQIAHLTIITGALVAGGLTKLCRVAWETGAAGDQLFLAAAILWFGWFVLSGLVISGLLQAHGTVEAAVISQGKQQSQQNGSWCWWLVVLAVESGLYWWLILR